MPSVQAILSEKGSHVLSISPRATVLDAAVMMNDHKIGALVVSENSRIRGIFTERDVLRRVVAERRDPALTHVEDVMTTDVVCCRPDTKIDEARTVFRNRRIRHLPVCHKDGTLAGMISIGDLNAWELNGQETTIQSLQDYLYGRI